MKTSSILRGALCAMLFAGAASQLSAAEPTLIGRRGCGFAVENTADAFREAVKRGHKYIEGHVRVTSDSVLVCLHDANTKLFGGNKTVATSKLADLQTERYTQTRENGQTYTGTVCTVNEFLDICKKGGAVALLHLKNLSKGTDPHRLVEVVDLVRSKGMARQSVMLASVPEFLDFIIDKAPDMSVMYQADDKWAQRLDWCVANKVPVVSIKKEACTPEAIAAYHAKGIKVAVWAINDPAEIASYPGIDFVITDLLTPKKK